MSKEIEMIECSSGGTQIVNITNINITINGAEDKGVIHRMLVGIFNQSKLNSDKIITTIEHKEKLND